MLREDYNKLIYYWVSKVAKYIPNHIDINDLYSAAALGLMTAKSRFDPDRGTSFYSFATPHIRGAILDELRAHDNLSRYTRDNFKKIEKEIHNSSNELGRAPTTNELAEALNITEEELTREMEKSFNISFVSIDASYDNNTSLSDSIENITNIDPYDLIDNDNQLELVYDSLDKLNPKKYLLLYLYYFEGITLKTIGEIFNITESRVCQVIKQCIKTVQNDIGDIDEI